MNNVAARYDYATIHGLINQTSVLHVSFTPDPSNPLPLVLPMIGQMGSFDQQSSDITEALDCYLHGAVSSRIMRLADEAVDRGEAGLPICIAATKVDGYVLAVTPFHHSYNFRSAVIHGHAQVVRDESERLFAMELITNSVVPERWQNTRTPPNKVELTSTNILRVKVYAASAKWRSGVPNYDKNDLKDPDMLEKYWAGVLPVFETIGEPLAGPENRYHGVPRYIKAFIEQTNKDNQRMAVKMAEEDV